MSDPGDKKRDVLRAAMEAARAVEEECTDAVPVMPVVRIRTRPEPVQTAECKHCGNPFWYKKSHGYRTHNGKHASWRVPCGWCSKPQYLPVDADNNIVDEYIESEPTREDLSL